ncbi:hypothetical protein V7266_11910 [Neobacillus drentensis]
MNKVNGLKGANLREANQFADKAVQLAERVSQLADKRLQLARSKLISG